MAWTSYDQESRQSSEDFERNHPDDKTARDTAYDRIKLELTVPPGAPDGLHQAHYGRPRLRGHRRMGHREKRPVRSQLHCRYRHLAACQSMNIHPSRLDEVFIEAWRYDQQTGRLHVTLVS